ncbi:MFS transporter [Larsenimonas salina]|uniref:MFS transporter n=1 Tax=Larsenimonas salina TaxID=1295565 RepID=UPI0020744C77|nr:MFS transporter [Larsenimonas salina]MCM5705439.1 MFS transporter [Larsenimonas salina]
MKKPALLPIELRAIVGLSSLYAVRMLGLFMLLPVLALYSSHLDHATPTLIGIALGVYGLTQAILQIPFGMLSDKIGRKTVISLGLGLFIIGSIVAALSESIYGVIAGRALQGSGAIAGAIMALLADRTREEVRTTAMAAVGMSIGLAFAAAMVAGPVLARFTGLEGIFWATAILATLSLVVLWKLVPAAPPKNHHDVGLNLGQIKTVITEPNLLRLDFSIFSLHLILTACFVAIPIRLKAIGIPAMDHGFIYLPVMAVAFVAMVPFIIAAEKYRKMKPVFMGAIATFIIALALIALLPSKLWGLITLLWVFFIAFNLMESMLPSMISKIAPAGAKGTAMGLYSTSQFLGASVGGVGGGVIASSFGTNGVFWFTSLVAIIWFIVCAPLKTPRHLSSVLLPLSDDQLKSVESTRTTLLNRPGVEDLYIATDEGVAYLKVDRERYESTEAKEA